MDRRRMFVSSLAVVAAHFTTPSVFAQDRATPEAEPERFEDLPLSEAMFAGLLQTWYDLLEASFERFQELAEDANVGSQRWLAKIAVEVSVWKALYKDVSGLESPDVFSESRDLLEESLDNLDRAADLIVGSIANLDAEAVNDAVVFIEEGAPLYRESMDALPFDLPDRRDLTTMPTEATV